MFRCERIEDKKIVPPRLTHVRRKSLFGSTFREDTFSKVTYAPIMNRVDDVIAQKSLDLFEGSIVDMNIGSNNQGRLLTA